MGIITPAPVGIRVAVDAKEILGAKIEHATDEAVVGHFIVKLVDSHGQVAWLHGRTRIQYTII